jgi:sugar phosphate isomerase/epimerase
MGRLGVCSWSLQPTGPDDLVTKVAATGLRWVQLALHPLRSGAWDTRETVQRLGEAGIGILSGMMEMEGEDYATLETIRATGGVAPDEHWEANLSAAHENAALARELGLTLVSFHAGFIPHGAEDPHRAKILDRLRMIVDAFAASDVGAAFETGQESAETLEAALGDLDRSDAGVNFDPANMILYGMGEPVAALRRLLPRVRQIHVKDALATTTPGTWGSEVRAGTGAVDWDRFFGVLRDRAFSGDLVIEREAGDRRIADVIAARKLVERHREVDA